MADDQYAPAELATSRLAGDWCSVHLPDRLTVTLEPARLLRELLKRREFDTIEGHARQIAVRVGLGANSMAALERELRDLVERGLLISKRTALIGKGERAAPAPPVTLGVLAVTSGRGPAAALACAEHFLAAFGAEGRRLALAIVDESGDLGAARDLRAGLERLAAVYGCPGMHVGSRERDALAAALAEVSGVDRATVALALTDTDEVGGTVAGCRGNVLLLALAGTPFVMVRDDARGVRGHAGDSKWSLVLSGARDPTRVVLVPARATPDSGAGDADSGLLAAFEALLGRRPADIAGHHPLSTIHFEQVDGELIRRLRADEPHVPVVVTGFRSGPPHRWQDPALTDHILGDPVSWARLAGAGAMVRQVPAPTLSPGSGLSASCMAVDTRRLLPPFTPVGCRQETTFGSLLAALDDGAFVGHLPRAPRVAAPADERASALPAPDGFESADVLEACLAVAGAGAEAAASGPSRFYLVGTALEELARRPASQFTELVHRRLWRGAAQNLDRWEDQLARHGPAHPEWARALRAHRDGLLAGLADRAVVVPRPWRGRAQGVAGFQRFVSGMGRLLQHWPTLVAAARDLRERHRGPFEALSGW